MKSKLFNWWNALRQTFWLVPSLMLSFSAGLAFLTLYLDSIADKTSSQAYTFYLVRNIGAEGLRLFLSTVASSMIGVTGVTFSITIVALTLASNQFGPRLLRGFMKDWGNQISLGTFISTFLYTLLILTFVPNFRSSEILPVYSVSVALLLTLTSLGVLIYFIHHMATQIQAEHLIARLGDELNTLLDHLYLSRENNKLTEEEEQAEEYFTDSEKKESCVIRAGRSGYIQRIDQESLLQDAIDKEMVIQIHQRPGRFVSEDDPLLRAYPAENCDDEFQSKLKERVMVGTLATAEQDAAFIIEQLVEVAVRSLSPGINDPFTAINCINTLGNSLARLSKYSFPSRFQYDSKNKVRLIVPSLSFAYYLNKSFHQIRQNARGSVTVRLRMLEVLSILGTHIKAKETLEVIRHHAKMIHEGSQQEGVLEKTDREEIKRRYEMVKKALTHDDVNELA